MHKHNHQMIDSSILASKRGIWAVKWSCIGLLIMVILQTFVVYVSGSVALLGDTIHKLGDIVMAIPLGIAFLMSQRQPTKWFNYGYGRVEDVVGLFIAIALLTSGIVAGYASIERFFHPQTIEYLDAIALVSMIGVIGNEAMARFRIKVGKEIGSAALIASGSHARIDGLMSLSVLLSVVGVWLGYPLADPLIGLLIAIMIFKIVWNSSIVVITHVLDGVEPDLVNQIKHAALQIKGVKEISKLRARWIGHQLHAELNITVDGKRSVEEGYRIATEVRQALQLKLTFLSDLIIQVDPS